MKIKNALLGIALVIGLNGCMSSAMVKRAKGYTDEQVQPLKGDTIISHGGLNYVVQQKHPEEAKKMPPVVRSNYYAFKRCPGCYAFLPLTVPLDVATSPFQLIGLAVETWLINGLGGTP